MGELYDAPNQQAVGGSPPWEEGSGGAGGSEPAPDPPPEGDLDAMTKDQLLAEAQSRGLSPANAGMTKDELRAVIDKG